ncbi:uncharacterized protein LOC130998083 [Salvia miltiorrhiza]|uniref:uncharacterized protein LOC130998083 n=1 Tax=Salvia miltiorrhiza TaxID=226208 RepID=UPI0025AB655C|nr:uncharacterized protein LOC130998083 [Salvia miltiorrhiza]
MGLGLGLLPSSVCGRVVGGSAAESDRSDSIDGRNRHLRRPTNQRRGMGGRNRNLWPLKPDPPRLHTLAPRSAGEEGYGWWLFDRRRLVDAESVSSIHSPCPLIKTFLPFHDFCATFPPEPPSTEAAVNQSHREGAEIEEDNNAAEEIPDAVEGEGDEKQDQEAVERPQKTSKYMTKYERARILGARALQISMNAPVMVELEGETDPLESRGMRRVICTAMWLRM